MPYFSNYAKDDENQGAAGQGQATDNGTFQRGASGAGADSANPSGSGTLADSSGAAPGASEKNAANTGSQYQSIDSYLGANADSNFGNRVTSKVGEQQQKGAADQQAAGGQFNQQVQGANQVPTGDQISGSVANPITADPKEYQKWMNQSYQGPKSLSDSASLQDQYWGSTKDAQTQTGQLAGNASGQYSLLNSYFGGPAGSSSYSSNNGPTGMQGLDLSLAQNTQGYGQNVANLRQGAANLQQQGLQGAQALQNASSQQAGNVEQSANAARSAVGVDKKGQIIQGPGGGAIGNLEGDINQGVTDANARNATNLTTLQNGGQLSLDELQQYGLDPNQQTYGDLSLGQYLGSAPALTAANTMTPDQLAKLKALQGLAGISPDTLGSTTLAAPGSPTIFDNSALQSAISSNKTNYETAWNTPTVQRQGETPTSMAQLQQVVDATRTQQAKMGRDPSNPATWTGSNGVMARDYINRINEFNSAHGVNNTVGNSTASKIKTNMV